MKKEFITHDEAKKNGYVYSGITLCGFKPVYNVKKELTKLAIEEELESGIKTFIVCDTLKKVDQSLTVYAEKEYLLYKKNNRAKNEIELIDEKLKKLEEEKNQLIINKNKLLEHVTIWENYKKSVKEEKEKK